jgi:site-specific recombinase XerD
VPHLSASLNNRITTCTLPRKSRQEVGSVLRALREARFRACLRLIYHAGLRVGEAVRLQVRHLHDTRSQGAMLILSSNPRRGCRHSNTGRTGRTHLE